MTIGKLETLAEICGCSPDELIEQAVYDSVVEGICTNDGCDYITDVEPDQRHGWCELCDTQTVCSPLVFVGFA
jgi:hypothetical protein